MLRRKRLTQGCSAERKKGRKEGRHTVARKIYIKFKNYLQRSTAAFRNCT
jgi:hypothetical protein